MPEKIPLTLIILTGLALALSACNLPFLSTPEAPPPEETMPPLPPATADYPTPSALAPLEPTPTITPLVLTATLITPLTLTVSAPLTTPLTTTLPAPTSPAAAEAIDPCSLLTKPEAIAILGEAVKDPIVDGLACSYTDETSQARLVSAYAAQGEQARNVFSPHLVQLGAFGLNLDQATTDQLYALDQAGANRDLLARLIELSKGNPAFSSRSVEGLGDLAYWAWKDTGHGVRQGFLIVLRSDVIVGDAIAGADLVVGEKVDEALALELTSVIVRQIFTRLPPQFIIATPTPMP